MSESPDTETQRTIRRHRLALIALFVLTIPIITPYLRGDGIAYYAYVASAVIDGDFHFENEYRHSDPGRCKDYFDADGKLFEHLLTRTGHPRNYHTSGPSFLWSPFFLTAHAGVLAHNAVVSPENAIDADGYSSQYLWMCALGTAIFALVGLLLAHAMAAAIVSPWSALVATLGIWFSSNLIVYMYLLPFMSHAAGAMTCGAFVFWWWRTSREPDELATIRTGREWFVLGLLTGLVFSVYYAGALFGIFVIADGLRMLHAAWQRGPVWRTHLRDAATVAIPGFAGVVIGAIPFFVPRWYVYGNPFELGYGAVPWQPMDPFILETLFSSNHGLLTWHPIYALALVGLVMLRRWRPDLTWRSLLVFGALTMLIASKTSWHGGSSFGNRYFLPLTPLFVIGLAALLEVTARALEGRLGTRAALARPALIALLLLMTAWNGGLLFQWGTNIIPNRGAVSMRQVAVNDVTVVPQKLVGFAAKFFTARDAMIKDIEVEDLEEFKEYLHGGSTVCEP